MKKIVLAIIVIGYLTNLQGQTLYFPPLTGNEWQKLTPEELGWCTDGIEPLYTFLEGKNTKAFLVLKDGKIVLEKYFGTFVQDSIWYWASAGKTLTGMLVGIAQKEGLLDIYEKSSKYLGEGWTSLSKDKEDLITIRHQLTMTSGLDDGTGEADCTLPSCLIYKAEAGTRWAYHNAPYTLLDKVIETASGKNYNTYFAQSIKNKIGMNGIWLKPDYNNVYYSTARSMARYGLLLLNKGVWNGNPVLNDSVYFKNMTNSSQNINQSYGYLTWLNGKDSYMLPQSQIVFGGSTIKDAPDDLFAALGKNGQIINVVPSKNLIVIRMGNPPNQSGLFVPNVFNNDIWKLLNDVMCNSTSSAEVNENQIRVLNNPVRDRLSFTGSTLEGYFEASVYDVSGKLILNANHNNDIYVGNLASGLYLLTIRTQTDLKTITWVKE